MRRLLKLFVVMLMVLVPVVGLAQIGSVPHTFTAGTTIISADVNTNFSTVYAAALNRTGGTMTGTLNVHAVLPTADNTYDLGSAAFSFKDAWIQGTLTVGAVASGSWTGDLLVSGGITASGNVSVGGTSPRFTLVESGVAANSGAWVTYADASLFHITGVNDVGAGLFDVMYVNRSNLVTMPGSLSVSGSISDGQHITSSTAPLAIWSDTSQGTDLKNWGWYSDGGLFEILTLTDVYGGILAPLVIDRAGLMQVPYGVQIGSGLTVSTGSLVISAGSLSASTTITAGTGITATTGNIVASNGSVGAGVDVTAGGAITATTTVTAPSGFKEHGRTFNAGASQAVGYASGNYTAQGGGSWTVGSGDATAYSYRIVGDSMWLNVTVDASSVSGTVTHLRVQVPGLVTTGETIVFPCLVGDNTSNVLLGVCSTVSGTDYIRVFKGDFSNFSASTDNTYIYITTPAIKVVG